MSIEDKLALMEERIVALEWLTKNPGPTLFVNRRSNHCRWVTDKGERFFVPKCYGGTNIGPKGCTCR